MEVGSDSVSFVFHHILHQMYTVELKVKATYGSIGKLSFSHLSRYFCLSKPGHS